MQAFSNCLGCFVYAKISKVKACIATRLMSVFILDMAKKMQRSNSTGAWLAYKDLVLRIEYKEIYC